MYYNKRMTYFDLTQYSIEQYCVMVIIKLYLLGNWLVSELADITDAHTKIAYYKVFNNTNLSIKHIPIYNYKLIVHVYLISCHYDSELHACVKKSCLPVG